MITICPKCLKGIEIKPGSIHSCDSFEEEKQKIEKQFYRDMAKILVKPPLKVTRYNDMGEQVAYLTRFELSDGSIVSSFCLRGCTYGDRILADKKALLLRGVSEDDINGFSDSL